jgi:superfamily II DNA or RNA helicase
MKNPSGTAPDFSLNLDSLRSHVDAATFELALQVLRNQQVLECDLLRSGSQTWDIEGRVSGSRFETYRASVTLESSAEGQVSHFDGRCSCPVGRKCKHSMALTLRAGYKSGGVFTGSDARPPAAKPPTGKPDAATLAAEASAREQARIEAERQQAQNKMAQWLDLFGQSPMPQAQAQADTAAEISTAEASDHVVYMLSAAQQGGQAVLQLGFGLSRRLKTGGWAKVKVPRSLTAEAAPEDLEIVQLIETLSARSYSYPYSANFGLVSGAAGMLALQMAATTGRLFAADDRVLGLPLTLGPALTLGWQWTQASAIKPKRPAALAAAGAATLDPEPVWLFSPKLPDAARGARWYANQPPLYLHEGSGICGVLEMPGMSAEHLQLLIKAPPVPQSALALHETTLLRHLAGLPLPPVMQAPEPLHGLKPLARLHINPVAAQNQARLGLLRASLQFDYGGVRHYTLNDLNPVLIELAADSAALPPPAADDEAKTPAEPVRSSTRRIQLYRDLPAEKAAHNALRALGLGGDSTGQFYLPFSDPGQQNQWLAWLDDDFATLRQAGFEVTSEPALAGWIARADDLQVALAAPPAAAESAGTGQSPESFDEGRSPWFNLSLGMLIAGQRQNILPLLPELLSQLSAVSHNDDAGGKTTLQLPEFIYLKQEDGHFLRLPCEPLRPWLQALLDLLGERSHARAGDFKADALRLSRLEALRLGAALGEGATWQGAEPLRQMVTQLGGRAELPPVAAPEGLMAQLRPYQLQGLQWLQFLRANHLAGILADDMGLGKTLQTLAHILIEKQAGRLDLPVLIIAPVSVMGNWRKEASRFTPQLSTLVLHGKDRHLVASGIAQHDIVIAPYSLLQRDRERWQQQAWHLVVLDEAQNIKNASSHAAQVVGELNTRHRLCLSGTPMENHLGELWSLFNFLMPGFLGSQARFKSLYRTPIEKRGDSGRAEQLRLRVTPFMLRRHKRDVATDLPEKQIAISSVELDSAQADLYETIRLSTEKTVRDALANKGLAKSQIQVLDALLKLRQVCCDPRLLAVPAAQKVRQSAKLELLMELLPELLAEGRKVLLFSQFTSMLTLIEEELVKRGIEWCKLTGQSQKRDQIIDRFTSGEVPLFLISLKAGGVGLNLTQADTVIHYDPWWNPAAETQATDRAHRIGQTQRVMVYKLVAQGTIEERILALQERKAALAESMYSAAEQRNGALFTESDLAALLRPLGS